MSWKVLLAAVLVPFIMLVAQAQPDRLTESIDDQHLVTITGHVRKIVDPQADDGPVESSFLIHGTLFLKPSVSQRAALRQLLLDLQEPHSSKYHQWLTPEEYALRFGISKSDAAKITDWLQTEGLTVDQVARGRSWIAFHGTAGAVETAFHADLHRYRTANRRYYMNVANPSVPRALAGVAGAIGGLDDFLPEPDYTAADGTHSLAPDDLATIYDFAPLLQSGIDGTGQKVVVVGESDLTPQGLSDFQAQMSHFNLPAPTLQQLLAPNFPDPGATSALGEAVGDLETIAGVARNATIFYVYSGNAYDALIYAVDENLAPVITASFHLGCDAQMPETLMWSYQAIAQQGNAQGITWVNSTGDSGAAGCDMNGAREATGGLATRFPADIPEVTAVGGTEFNEQGGSYWSPTNNANSASALSYIPEMAWNESASLLQAWASGRGASAFFQKPSWQTGPGVPNDGARDVPDVALAAALYHDPYLQTFNGVTQNVGGGTSAAAPLFAGMMVLLNHYLVANAGQTEPGLGNLNQMLYRLAQTSPSALHDVTTGSNIVPCLIGTPNCTTGSMGYNAGPGFDLATGLGSIDLAKLAPAALALPIPASPEISVVANAEGQSPTIAPNTWVDIQGSNLAPGTRTWQASDFVSNQMPSQLDGISATVNGMSAYIFYISPTQVNILTPPYAMQGPVRVVLTNNGATSAAFTAQAQTLSPSFFVFDGTHVAAVHLNGTLLGPTTLYPGSSTPATPGETVVLYANGFGPTSTAVITGSVLQSGTLSPLPTVEIGGVSANVLFAGLVAPGEFQFNVVVPSSIAAGDQPITATYDDLTTQLGTLITIQ